MKIEWIVYTSEMRWGDNDNIGLWAKMRAIGYTVLSPVQIRFRENHNDWLIACAKNMEG